MRSRGGRRTRTGRVGDCFVEQDAVGNPAPLVKKTEELFPLQRGNHVAPSTSKTDAIDQENVGNFLMEKNVVK